ncbi:MAG: calcium-binding protein [Microlunatus sp.]
MSSWSDEQLDDLIAEATVDCYDDGECATGFYTVLDEQLDLPFRTEVLGVEVTVTGIDLTDDNRIVAVCVRGKSQQRVGLVDLSLPAGLGGVEWVEAYRRWARWQG